MKEPAVKYTLVIADDHPLFIDGLRSLIMQENNLSLAGEAASGRQAVELIRKLNPDLAILDIELKDISGYQVAETIIKENLKTKIIFLTMYDDIEILTKALGIGVKGYLLKEHTSSEVLNCINTVLAGKTYISSLLSDNMLKIIERAAKRNSNHEFLERLTISERRILRLISLNKTSREIAKELNVSPKTIDNHRRNICDKLNIHGSNALIKFAIENREKI